MKIHVTGRHIRLSKALNEYVEKKLAKAQKYFSDITWAEVILSVQKRSHQAEIVLHASQQTFRALAAAADLYAAIDLASDKIDTQLRKHKERLKQRKKSAAPTAELVAQDMDPRPVQFSVVKEVSLVPTTPELAAQEMDRLGYNFWMFQDQESRQIQVIFRRIDDSFGLLLPAKRGGR